MRMRAMEVFIRFVVESRSDGFQAVNAACADTPGISDGTVLKKRAAFSRSTSR
jgi:hypothetical protein